MGIYRSAEGHRRIRAWCDERLTAWGHPHERRLFATSLGPTHVVTTGSGPPVVLVPGTNFAAATWLDLVAAASETHTVHALDLPGQPGLSSPDRPRQPRARYGRWLAELLPQLAPEPATLVGHSLGARVVLGAAVEGAAVARLVLLDPAGIKRLRVSAALMRATLPWLRTPDARTSARLLEVMSAPDTTPDQHQVRWMTLVGRHARTSLAPAPTPGAELARLRHVPITVLSGGRDVFLPAGRLVAAVERRLPGAQIRIVEGAGHLLPHELPELVVDHLAKPEGSMSCRASRRHPR